MRKSFALSLVLAAGLAAPMLAQSEGGHSEVGVSALGAFPSGSDGNGTHQGGTYSGGVLVDYRFLFTNHQGVEVDYGYTRGTQQFRALAGVQNDQHEVSASYVYRFPVGRLAPFVSAGVGGVVFNPVLAGSSSPLVPDTQARVAFVYGAGVDYMLTHHLSFRAQYRGLVFKAPDFATGFGSASAMHLAEPAGGLVWRF